MKNLLEDSPLQEARRAHHEPEPESPEQVSSDHEDSESGGAASDDGGDEGAAEESESEVEPEEEAPVPTSQDSSESVNSEAGAGSNHGGDDDDANDGGASEHSVLPREPGSQREGAWIGSFYQENSSEGRSPDMPPRNVRSKAERPQQLYDPWVTDIMRNLRDDHGLDEHPMIEEYKKHCIRALDLYGNHVFATLCSARHFNEWLHEQKGQDAGKAVDREPKDRKAGFKAALNLMRLDATVVDEAWSKTPVCKRPASSEEVAEGLVLTPPPVVGPQSAKRMANLKRQAHGEDIKPAQKKAKKAKSPSSEATASKSDDDRVCEKMATFKGYDLKEMGLPVQAMPSADGDYRGAHSYTLCVGRAAIEVLLKHKAFFVKRLDPGHDGVIVSQREMTMRRRVKKVIEKTKAKVPFMEETGVSRPRLQSPCEAHRGNVMSALRFLRVIGTLMAMLFSLPLDWGRKVTHVETFAGCASVTRGEIQEGRPHAVALDKEYGGPEFDLLSNEGFCNALYYTACLEPGSSKMAAPVCSTFVFMSRASTLRSESNPMGRSDSEAVRNGNILACRCFILLLLASCKGCWWLMEQPSTSTMEYMPCFQHLMALVSVRKMVLSLADYGSPTLKRTNLYSSSDAIDSLPDYRTPRRLRPREMVRHYIDGSGQKRVCGGKHLRASQAYPREFGLAIARCRTQHKARHLRLARQFLRDARKSTNSMDTSARINKIWKDGANLEPVLTFLSNGKYM
ncbi:unnamed protein product [Cladocopium goreaui]|uniref:Uncharacterized protein n=1 Tax=Cladocopium goreaui TaxID=2562237 RepID=A0A9P1G5V5_9DINO|nr:unnamed protein product [Cladocopium goreaui]